MEFERYELIVFKDNNGKWSCSCHTLGYTTAADNAYEAVMKYIEKWPMTLQNWCKLLPPDSR